MTPPDRPVSARPRRCGVVGSFRSIRYLPQKRDEMRRVKCLEATGHDGPHRWNGIPLITVALDRLNTEDGA